MAYDAAAGKSLVRAIVHNTFGLTADYRSVDAASDAPAVPLRVRWHNKVTPRGDHGDLLDIGYADVIEGIDVVIFNSNQVVSEGLSLKRGDTVTITSPRFGMPVLTLQTLQPDAGPQEIIWQVAHE